MCNLSYHLYKNKRHTCTLITLFVMAKPLRNSNISNFLFGIYANLCGYAITNIAHFHTFLI